MKAGLFSPGILGFVAAAAAFAYAYDIWWNYTYVDPRPELDFLAIPFVNFFTALGLFLTYIAVRSIIGTKYQANGRAVLSGSMLTALSVLPGIYYYTPTMTAGLISVGLFLGSLLGIVGGLRGIYWGKSWRAGAAVPELAEYSRWAIIGGIAMFIDGPWSSDESTVFLLFFVQAIIVPLSGVLVYKGVGSQKLLALLIIAGALWRVYPFWLFSGLFDLNYYYFTIVDILGFAGVILSVIAGVKMWTSRVTKHNSSSNNFGMINKPQEAPQANNCRPKRLANSRP